MNSDERLMWLQTHSLSAFHYKDPLNRKSTIDIQDIGRSLALQPRFCAHSSVYLSVAEHSVAVGFIYERLYSANPYKILLATLHDAHEAYTGDIPGPFIRYLKAYKDFDLAAVQAEIQSRIHKHFGLIEPDNELCSEIVRADLHALETERRMYCKSNLDWGLGIVEPFPNYTDLYHPLTPAKAYADFLSRINFLVEAHANALN